MKVILIQAFNIKQRPAKKQDTITNCEGSVTYKHLKLMKTKNKTNKQTNDIPAYICWKSMPNE